MKNGALVDCPNAVAEQVGGHTNQAGMLFAETGTNYWGAYGHTAGTAYWGATTGELKTHGCRRLSFRVFAKASEGQVSGAKYYVYGDGEVIAQSDINYSPYAETSATIDISDYSSVEVRVRISDDSSDANCWCGAGLVEVKIHN